MRPALPFAASLALLATPSLAEAPRVIADTPPVHSLVVRVMEGVGTPELLLPPGGSPHDAALRPSDARRLSQADLMVWTGPALLPWLPESLEALAPEARSLALLETEGWEALPLRHDPAFDTGPHDGHGHGHDEDDDHDAHDDDHGDDHDHDHDAMHGGDAGARQDPHAWLDPQVAAVWMEQLAEELARADPENAGLYRDNAAAAIAADAGMSDRIAARLAPLAGRPYLVPHDAYQYFETRFGLPAAGAIALSDATAPGAARLTALRERVEAGDIACVLSDPETPADLVTLLREGTGAATAATDPAGLGLTPGPDLYPALIEGLAQAFEECLG
ncbi:zinc ABC transporter substrate-binding protein [Limimaricola litoreus]|uniref:High-affinity zinc uptake system protein ZnuA n=1 Tax=Limimaricola litoreus TaxID=2955316 RepID=A0A9X2FYI0_9RHOB|nr:zinc ABC transporter substrate-binding protein [Limimaricola litoreus]MCP1169838.1 zinc ABC transporter substrate-binding protein [Limimaricola litoreus]